MATLLSAGLGLQSSVLPAQRGASLPTAPRPVESGTDKETSGEEWPRVTIKDVYIRDAAKRALTGASKMLGLPRCESLFSEFHDVRGLPLAEKLRELAVSPRGYLDLILFLDGEQRPQCRKERVLAFTTRGSRVVYLCGRDFERAERRDAQHVQATLVHEMLHSLGLGENPPSPGFITDRVRRLCW